MVMEVLEHLVLAHPKKITDPELDPLQFAYRANRSIEDAVNMSLLCPGTSGHHRQRCQDLLY